MLRLAFAAAFIGCLSVGSDPAFADSHMPDVDENGAASSSVVNAKPGVVADRRNIGGNKRTKLGLYLDARQAHTRIKGNREAILFIDVRSRAEIQLLGMPIIVDANIPLLDFHEPYVWDDERKRFKQDQNPDFEAEIARRLAAKKLNKSSTIVLISRSGIRSARAANLLADEGYKKVYSVIDGFEGDEPDDWPRLAKRPENGWKTAGLPWTYKLDPKKMFKEQAGAVPR